MNPFSANKELTAKIAQLNLDLIASNESVTALTATIAERDAQIAQLSGLATAAEVSAVAATATATAAVEAVAAVQAGLPAVIEKAAADKALATIASAGVPVVAIAPEVTGAAAVSGTPTSFAEFLSGFNKLPAGSAEQNAFYNAHSRTFLGRK